MTDQPPAADPIGRNPTECHRTGRSTGRIAALAVASLTLAPLVLPAAAMVAVPIVSSVTAQARPGGGMSFGSRGLRSFSAPSSTSIAPRGAMPFLPSRPRMPFGGFGSRPLLHGFVGGLLGAGLFGLLLGHGFFGAGFGALSLLGLILQIGLLYLLARWVMRRLLTPAARGAGGNTFRFAGGASQGGGAGYAGSGQAPLMLQPQDYRAFEAVLMQVQSAWTRQDLSALRQVATPEMAQTFAAQIADLARRGHRNAVSDVRLEKGELSEAWRESGAQYATVAMRYSLIDVTTDMSGRIVQGNPSLRELVTEFWTYVRRPGGPWQLSAIQQTA